MKSILMLLSGVICLAGGLLHASGFRLIHGEVAKAGVTGDLAEIVDLAWVFMSMGFLTFGAILITCGLQMRKKNYGGRSFGGWAAAFLTVFSGWATIRFGFNWHSLYFLIVGLLAAFACIPEKRASV
ncbi:MAG TPA: hypothetical protein VKD70_14360 [Candidatus Acidoferrum sp.]|nr:hypothetical protein [Candidatus Acidoferrum sp.]